jgi:hypothetical protein
LVLVGTSYHHYLDTLPVRLRLDRVTELPASELGGTVKWKSSGSRFRVRTDRSAVRQAVRTLKPDNERRYVYWQLLTLHELGSRLTARHVVQDLQCNTRRIACDHHARIRHADTADHHLVRCLSFETFLNSIDSAEVCQ